ncbi:MAG: glycoside hydrolase family 97 protein [Rhizobacter sp.]|nr:glycoside hydrolase family 97 protein [Ferruginibacter sp.]
MMIKKVVPLFAALLLTLQLSAAPTVISVTKGKVDIMFRLNETGQPQYSVQFNKKDIVKWSSMGFSLDKDSTFYKDFELIDTQKKVVNENWQPVLGEVKNIRNSYEQLTVQLKKKTAPGYFLNIVFRVFEDGVGFRYVFPKQKGLDYFVVTDEYTQFNLTGDHKSFWIPGDYDTNEYLYSTSLLSKIDNTLMVKNSTDIAVRTVKDKYAVQTPLMMKTSDGLYINIHEAAQLNYPAMQLHVDNKNFALSSSLVPDAVGNKAYLRAASHTPWRTIIVSDKSTEILASKMILNLNEPSFIKNTSWIKPMKFVGVWWEMQTGKSTWSYSEYADSTTINGELIPNNRHGANTANVKKYIDFASKHGIQGVLVEGWNVGWEDWFGNWKENVFDFVTPYPDFDLKAITAYAKSKNVKMIMHHETSGAATNYERYLDTAFRFMNNYGYTSVKTGYVGKIIPRGETHDGQWMTNHYERVAQKAALYKIMIDVHEPMRPTGIHRTYPNWLASEAGRGNEYNAFSIGSPPEHETILPFTRYMGGPMDFTPGIFKLKNYATGAPDRQMHSTLAKQLALYVVLYSPLQMAADLPENYEAKPDAFQFIKDVPTDWDDTKIIAAEPGDFIATARKEKGRSDWFIGAITDEENRTIDMPLDFLDKGETYKATIYKDGPDADWKNNPESYTIENLSVQNNTVLKIKLAAGGGCAIRLQKIRKK